MYIQDWCKRFNSLGGGGVVSRLSYGTVRVVSWTDHCNSGMAMLGWGVKAMLTLLRGRVTLGCQCVTAMTSMTGASTVIADGSSIASVYSLGVPPGIFSGIHTHKAIHAWLQTANVIKYARQICKGVLVGTVSFFSGCRLGSLRYWVISRYRVEWLLIGDFLRVNDSVRRCHYFDD